MTDKEKARAIKRLEREYEKNFKKMDRYWVRNSDYDPERVVGRNIGRVKITHTKNGKKYFDMLHAEEKRIRQDILKLKYVSLIQAIDPCLNLKCDAIEIKTVRDAKTGKYLKRSVVVFPICNSLVEKMQCQHVRKVFNLLPCEK